CRHLHMSPAYFSTMFKKDLFVDTHIEVPLAAREKPHVGITVRGPHDVKELPSGMLVTCFRKDRAAAFNNALTRSAEKRTGERDGWAVRSMRPAKAVRENLARDMIQRYSRKVFR
ncbi:hypothetical protein, partial [Duodenibacillus massiliensis]|uniref:hypothetical protein n=1 Tax=Duodenibacillus massiliensis TaxID=1852381 RepID=UPI00307C9F4F